MRDSIEQRNCCKLGSIAQIQKIGGLSGELTHFHGLGCHGQPCPFKIIYFMPPPPPPTPPLTFVPPPSPLHHLTSPTLPICPPTLSPTSHLNYYSTKALFPPILDTHNRTYTPPFNKIHFPTHLTSFKPFHSLSSISLYKLSLPSL